MDAGGDPPLQAKPAGVGPSAAEPPAEIRSSVQVDRGRGGRCLVGFVVFVIVRGPSQPANAGNRSARVEAAAHAQNRHDSASLQLARTPRRRPSDAVGVPWDAGHPQLLRLMVHGLPGGARRGGHGGPRRSGQVAVVGVDSNETSDTGDEQPARGCACRVSRGPRFERHGGDQVSDQALPVTYFVGAQGRVVGAALGPQTVASLNAGPAVSREAVER